MTGTIWRVELAITDEQTITVPDGFRPLSVAAAWTGEPGDLDRGPVIELWFWCDPDSLRHGRRIAVAGTGHPTSGAGVFVGTVVYELRWGRGVWHVFDLGPAEATT